MRSLTGSSSYGSMQPCGTSVTDSPNISLMSAMAALLHADSRNRSALAFTMQRHQEDAGIKECLCLHSMLRVSPALQQLSHSCIELSRFLLWTSTLTPTVVPDEGHANGVRRMAVKAYLQYLVGSVTQ